MTDRNYELDILTRTILGEAGGEDAYGQAAVGSVIRNRTRDPRWGGSFSSVSLAPKQFSTWNSGAGGNNPGKFDPNSEAYKRTRKIAEGIMDGTIEDKTGGATHYYSPKGMDALVAEGSQNNTIPKWLQEEGNRRGGQNYTYGGHVFTGKAAEDEGVLTASTSGEKLGTQNPYAPENAITAGPMGQQGALSNEFVTGMARQAIDRGGQNPADGSNPDWYFGPGGANGGNSGGQPTVSTQGQDEGGALDQSNAEAPAEDNWLNRNTPKWLNQDRSQMLLGIGAGLLSGDDWASGIGAASENLMGVNQGIIDRRNSLTDQQTDRQNQLMDNRTDQENSLARITAQNEATGGQAYNSPMNLVGRNLETGQEMVVAGSFIDGQYMVPGADGQLVPASSVMRDVRVGGRNENQDVVDGAGGIPNATFVGETGMPSFNFKRESEAKNFGYAVRAIGSLRDFDAISATMPPEQMTSLGANFQRWAATNSQTGITAGTINSIVNESGLQGAAAAAMSAYLQSVLRADTGAAYTGTEFSNYGATFLPSTSASPEEAHEKALLRNRELQRFAASTGDASPYVIGLIEGKYDLPGGTYDQADVGSGALDQSNAGSGLAAPEGVDPETWKFMTPEQQKLWAD